MNKTIPATPAAMTARRMNFTSAARPPDSKVGYDDISGFSSAY